MTCREFIRKIEGFTLTELGSADAELLAHQNGCASCAALLQQRHALAGAMQVLRSRTLAMEAPVRGRAECSAGIPSERRGAARPLSYEGSRASA